MQMWFRNYDIEISRYLFNIIYFDRYFIYDILYIMTDIYKIAKTCYRMNLTQKKHKKELQIYYIFDY